ncbi:glycosyltransferase [Rheinheimera sp. F8]|uniref:glycosyltransferase n=1 Tax=Rheinheimera sp. F8 TaxID=1763998 RepID=UPI000744D2D7|nr:glycosyltransferase [Rheinheimera sp. F8]ALZ77054.1 hypothetical protein ATY27_15680 [Rheinheimera sp. F8]
MSAATLVVLMCSYNRQARTLAALGALFAQQVPAPYQLQVFLLDDGSSDGTADAVTTLYPQVCLLHGNGQLYWNGAMRLAWQHALTKFPDASAFVWLNDDVLLDDDALLRLVQAWQLATRQNDKPVGAVVGAMREPGTVRLSYGGRCRHSVLQPLRQSPVLAASDQLQRCDFINGNWCLIPADVVAQIGILSPQFTHSMGDYDYGLRALQAGFQLYQAPGSFGECAVNSGRGGVLDAALPMAQRLQMLNRPNRWPPAEEWRGFVRTHGGPLRGLSQLRVLLRQYCPRLFLWLRQRHFPPVAAAAPQLLPRRQVVIVQQVLKQYRVAYFDQLAAALAQQQIELTVLFGVADGAEAQKGDNISVAPAAHYQAISVKKFGPWVWQWHEVLEQADVVIVEQANRHLLNYWLLWRRKRRDFRLVFWGHGYDHQANNTLRARWKQFWLRRCDHFLAYTAAVGDWLVAHGMPAAQITVLNNSLDTKPLLALPDPVSEVSPRPLVLLYCGALYPAKQLPLLLQSCAALYQAQVISQLIVLGDGPQRDLLVQTAASAPWLDYRGACFGADKVQAYQAADLVLNPGLTGLAILDAFSAGLPYLTTQQPDHSPEISYLQHGYNGYLLAAEVTAIVTAVTRLQQDPELLQQLGQQARYTAGLYSLDNMVAAASQAILSQLPALADRQYRLLHQAYRQQGGEDQVVAREQALFASNGVALSAVVRQTPPALSVVAQLRAVAGWFGLSVDTAPLLGLSRGDVLLVHNLFPLLSPFLLSAARRRGIRTVLYLHNFRLLTPAASLLPGESARAPGWSLLLQQWRQPGRPEGRVVSVLLALALWWQYRCQVWQQADVLVCPSEFVRKQFQAAGVAAAKLLVKPHYAAAPGQWLGVTQAPAETPVPPFILFVGRAEPAKGLPFLLQIWRDVPGLPELWVAGAGTEQLAPVPGVRVLGRQDQSALGRLYQQACLVVVPSMVAETFGNVVTEAYAYGTPVLVANSGALAELVQPAVTGLMFQTGDRADFLAKLQQLLAEPQTTARMGEQARQRYQQLYSSAAQRRFYHVFPQSDEAADR